MSLLKRLAEAHAMAAETVTRGDFVAAIHPTANVVAIVMRDKHCCREITLTPEQVIDLRDLLNEVSWDRGSQVMERKCGALAAVECCA